MSGQDDELAPTQTPGYKVGERRTISELASLDAEDESLQKWKASLGIQAGASSGDPTATPQIQCEFVRMLSSEGDHSIIVDLQQPQEKLDAMKQKPPVIKEGSKYCMEIQFKVVSGLVSGLKYIQLIKRMGVTVDKEEQMLGSFGPSTESVVRRFDEDEAPSGFLARATYTMRSKLIDDDGHVYAEQEWPFKIAKDWEK